MVEKIIPFPLDYLFVGVHPDDVELSASGILLRCISQGKKVGILDLTQGELGSRGTAETRKIESQNASALMGLHARINLGMKDGFFEINEINHKKIIEVLRAWTPRAVLANAISDRHPDHGRAAKLIHDACFLSGLVKINTQDSLGNEQLPWRPKQLYHYIQDYLLKPDILVDVTEFFPKKMEVVKTYKTQFFNPEEKGPETPISSKEFLDSIEGKARAFGRYIGVQYAEGLVASRPIGIEDLDHLF
jgi:N-acetylglucosamine malate deacetylase 1